jgi:hypothetical protein
MIWPGIHSRVLARSRLLVTNDRLRHATTLLGEVLFHEEENRYPAVFDEDRAHRLAISSATRRFGVHAPSKPFPNNYRYNGALSNPRCGYLR